MAEGDTVLRIAGRLEQALGGERLDVATPSPRAAVAGVARLDGELLTSVRARGKHLLFDFGRLVLHSHLAMSGSWHLYRRGESWRAPARAAWAVLGASEFEAVQFAGPTLRVLAGDRLHLDPWLARLGPDILAADFDLDTAVLSLRFVPDRGLGEALLDQNLLAGIGNVFKNEACFAARADPWTRIEQLSDAELRRVLRAARGAMRDAVATGRRPAAVYRRAGRPCSRCATTLSARGQGDSNRTTYWCPCCQSGSGRSVGETEANPLVG